MTNQKRWWTLASTFGAAFSVAIAQPPATVIDSLDLSAIPAGTIHRFWLTLGEDTFQEPIKVPLLVAKGLADGPTLGIVAAIHGNELNGIAAIQRLFEGLDPQLLRGVIIAVPGANRLALELNQRTFPDGVDINRVFPGKARGDESAQFAHRFYRGVVPHLDVLLDLHTASFGRENTFYVRADLENDTLAQLARLQAPDIILHSTGKPSAGQAGNGLTLREAAADDGVIGLTMELGNPQVYQEAMVERGLAGLQRALAWLDMLPAAPALPADHQPVYCRRSYWLYTDAGGLLEVYPPLGARLEAGELIARLRNPFGDVIREYFAPEAGVVIGKSSNPAGSNGARILHLGRLATE
ncbi:MAG: succinylglutamate desuccinylase/aspartoacylase family protein [Lewinella sp.]|nr:succinylglutamate desuccinylase/aspartoacylase family protein [Lewinella sp.]